MMGSNFSGYLLDRFLEDSEQHGQFDGLAEIAEC